MSKYKLIQLTNNNIGAVAANGYLPLGLITRKLNSACNNCATFQVTSSTSDALVITEPGYYKITYVGNLSAAAAGNISVTLVTNQQAVVSATETVAAADDVANIVLSYVIRICPNCCSAPYNCPVSVQFQLGSEVATSATEDSTSNIIVEKLY